MLVELNLVEQRYQAVLEVLNEGATITESSSPKIGTATARDGVSLPMTS